MSDTKYSYSIAQDFPNQKVAPDRLTLEIEDSAITAALDHIDTIGDSCDIWFKEELSVTDQSILSTIVSQHSGEPLPRDAVKVAIASSDVVLPMQTRGFPDYSGYPYFADSLYGVASAGVTSHFYLSNAQIVRIQGGGFWVGNAAQHGDYVKMEMTYGVGGPVVGCFVNKMYVWPERQWERALPDSMEIPVGIALRLSYVSTGTEDVEVISWYDLRRTPNA